MLADGGIPGLARLARQSTENLKIPRATTPGTPSKHGSMPRKIKPANGLNTQSYFTRIHGLFPGELAPILRQGFPQLNYMDYCYEKNIPAQRYQAQAHPRLSRPYGNQERPPGTEPSPRKRPQAPGCIMPGLGPGGRFLLLQKGSPA